MPTQRIFKVLPPVVVGVLLWNLPVPEGMPEKGWEVFSVFLPVIVSFLLKPFPTGVSVLIGLLSLVLFRTIDLDAAMKGYSDTVVWLVVSAFFIAGGIIRTGLGKRIALLLVHRFGHSMTGLGYAIGGTELILGPVIPSNTARGGGVVAPVVRALSEALGSHPREDPRKAGEYLALVGAQTNLIAAAMFMTGMAANPLVSQYAQEAFGIEFGWGDWALGAIVPGLVSMAILPPLLKKVVPPRITDTSKAREQAMKTLEEMGPPSRSEWVTAGVFGFLIALWATSSLHGLSTTTVALSGVLVMLVGGVLTWEDIIRNQGAWDTFVWLGGLLTLTTLLKTEGFIGWVRESLEAGITGMEGIVVLVLLGLVYFYSMYLFSMLTAHITALIPAFFALCLAGNAPVFMSVILFATFSNLCGCLTNYSTGPLIIYFGLDYVTPKRWFSTGFVVGVVHILVWLTIGFGWWVWLGWV